MCGVKIVSASLLLSLVFCASSCTRTRATEADLLSTGLVGWQRIGGDEGAWHFTDGVLRTDSAHGGWLATYRQYDNFALSVEFRVPPGAESGLFFRAPLEGDPAYTGVVIPLVDDDAARARSATPYQYTGSIYGVQAPADRASKPAGEWQKMVVIARGPQIQVGLNGRKIVDTDLTHHSHKAQTRPGLTRTGGYIGLQGSGVEFRNITIRELPEI